MPDDTNVPDAFRPLPAGASTSGAQESNTLPAADYQALIGSFAQAVWETDAAGRVVADSPAWRAYTGQTAAEMRGDGWLRAIRPDDYPDALRQWKQAISAQTPVNTEFYLRRPDGSWQWINLRATPLLNPDGVVSRWIAAIIDSSERKQAEETGRHSAREQAFLITLSDRLRPLTDAAAIQQLSASLLGEHLKADRLYYADIDEEQDLLIIQSDYAREGLSHLAGRHAVSAVQEWIDTLRTGQPLVVDDVRHATGFSEPTRSYLVTLGMVAFLSVPLISDGRLVWTLNVMADGRQWTANDVTLAQEVAEQTWANVERARTQEDLRRLEERTRIALEAAEMGTWEWNLVTDEVYWNEQHFRLFGMEPPRAGGPQQPLTPDDFSRHVHPDDLDRVMAKLQRLIREKEGVYEAEFRAVRDDGKPAWMRGYGRITAVTDGRPTRLSGIMYDITERIQADQALRDSDERFRTLMQNLPDYAIFRTDPSGIITEWTSGAQWVTGYTADEVIGQNVTLFYTPEGLAAGELVEELAEATQTGRAEREVIQMRKDGSRFCANQIATAIYEAGGRLVGFTKISRDITARKQAEEALRESEGRLSIVMESITDYAIITTDTQGVVTGWLSGARQLFGFTAEEAIGQPNAFIFTPEDQAAGAPDQEIVMARRQGRAADERYHIRKDGSRFYVSGVMSPLHNAEGQVLGYVKVARDLTERQRMEQALREADKRKDEFLAVLAHELRNPLAPIRNVLQFLTLTGEDKETIAPAVALMSRQVNHLVRLIDDLLDVSRINQGKIELRRERLDFTSVVRQAAEAIRPLYASTRRTLTVSLPASPIWVNSDATRLTQVVTNLLTNGARYTLENGQVWLTLAEAGSEALLRVSDNGIGLAPEQLPAIFDMFVQGDNSLSRSQGGLGLGLTLVQKLVDLHGGRVEARSDGLGRGSAFLVFLPRLPQAEPSMTTDNEKNKAAASPRRMLVVDDNRDAADTLAMLLKLKKNDVHTRYSGQEALEAIESLQPQVAFLDISMPGLDGYETCRLIRREPWGKSVVLIALTGYGQDDDKRHSQEAGFDGHLVKPVDLPVLLRLVDELLAAPDNP